jgi:hypothetical protein
MEPAPDDTDVGLEGIVDGTGSCTAVDGRTEFGTAGAAAAAAPGAADAVETGSNPNGRERGTDGGGDMIIGAIPIGMFTDDGRFWKGEGTDEEDGNAEAGIVRIDAEA